MENNPFTLSKNKIDLFHLDFWFGGDKNKWLPSYVALRSHPKLVAFVTVVENKNK